MVSQVPKAARPAAMVIPSTISLPGPVPSTPVSAASALPISPLVPGGPGRARPAPGAAGAGVTTGNRCAMLPGLGVERPGTVPRGSAGGRASGPLTAAPAEVLPLCPGGAGPLGKGEADRDGLGDGLGHDDVPGEGDGLGEGDALGQGDLLGDGDGLGDGDLLGDGDGDGDLDGDGDGLGEGDLLGDGGGEGDGDPVAAAPVPGRTASRMPAAIAPPPTMARAPVRGRAGTSPWCGWPALLRVRAAGVITAAWTRSRPRRFPRKPGMVPGFTACWGGLCPWPARLRPYRWVSWR